MRGNKYKISRFMVVIVTLLAVFVGVLTKPVVALAIDENAVAPPAEPYNSGGSVVQVVFIYTDEAGARHIIQSGSGILLDNRGVLTTRSTITLTEETKQNAGAYLSSILGKNLTFYQPPEEEKDQWEVISAQLAVVVEADIYSLAEVKFESVDWDVAFLELSDDVHKEPAMLGDSSLVQIGDSLRTQGYPNMDYTAPQSFTTSDVLTYEGVCSDLSDGLIRHTCDYRMGCVGGPIVDQYGRVVAIITYVPGESDVYSALPVNQIKIYLDSKGFAYRQDNNDYRNYVEAATGTDAIYEDPDHQVFKNQLYDAISEAEFIIEKESNGVYTEESYRDFELAYEKAVKIYESDKVLQDDVDKREAELRAAIANLKKIEHKSKTLLIVIIVAGSVLAVAFILLIIFLIIRGRRKKAQKEEAMRIKTIDGGTGTSGALNGEAPNLRNVGLPSAQLYAQFDAKQKNDKHGTGEHAAGSAAYMEPSTTILQDEEGTTVLNSFIHAPINAYLYRSKTGESIAITSDVFRVGKNTEGLEYRIDGNTNVSRFHAVITRRDECYFIEDLGSTNYTFVNSVRIMPNRKQMLQSNDVIYMADEEFIFMING